MNTNLINKHIKDRIILKEITADSIANAQIKFGNSKNTRFVLFVKADHYKELSNPTFKNWLDPVTRYELINTGHVANLMGMEVFTDAIEFTENRWLTESMLVILTGSQSLRDILKNQSE